MRSQRTNTGMVNLLAALSAATVFTLAPNFVAAQMMDDVSVSVRGGAAIPSSDMADVSDVGARVGADLSWWMSDQFALGVDGGVDILPANDENPAATLPDLRLWHYGVGAKLDLVQAQASPWSVIIRGGAGATTLDSDTFIDTGAPDPNDLTETYFRVNGGLDVGYRATDNVRVAVYGGSYITFVDEADMALLAAASPTVDPFDQAYTFPVTAEIEIGLPN